MLSLWEKTSGFNEWLFSQTVFLELICMIVLFTLLSTLQILAYQEDKLKVFCRLPVFLKNKSAICEANFHTFTGFECSSLHLEFSEIILIESK